MYNSYNSKPLIILESPTKAKHIPEFTMNSYEGVASKGHIKDLPKNEMGLTEDEHGCIDFNHVSYLVTEDKKETVKVLKSKSHGRQVYLATDPDREGESIAYDVMNEIGGLASKISRIDIHEITAKGVQDALKKPRDINFKTVEAQRARRFIDRIAGYKLTKYAARALGTSMWNEASVGRTQSAALKMVYDRDMAIKNFKPEPYWRVVYNDTRGSAFISRVFKKHEEAEAFKRIIDAKGANIASVEAKKQYEGPPAPLTASTLQQRASRMFGFTPQKTMQVAQSLYEEGHITYMRTDSVRLAPETQELCKRYLEKAFKDLAPSKPPVHKNKGGNTQDAHEAIHPTRINETGHPDKLISKAGMTDEQKKLYTLIWNTFIASQCAPAEWDVVKASAGNKYTEEQLTASSRLLTFDGWRRIINIPEKENERDKIGTLKTMYKQGEKMEGKTAEKEDYTKPPSYYTEATFLKALEDNGVGRPATWAQICSIIMDRNYVHKEGRDNKLTHTEKGRAMVMWLMDVCPILADVKFTSKMEDDLALIESGEQTKQNIVNTFNAVINECIKRAEEIPNGKYHFQGVDYSNTGAHKTPYKSTSYKSGQSYTKTEEVPKKKTYKAYKSNSSTMDKKKSKPQRTYKPYKSQTVEFEREELGSLRNPTRFANGFSFGKPACFANPRVD